MIEGFLLGLSNGVACLTTCSQVLIPLLLGEGHNSRRNILLILQFLGGRLVGYLLFALLAWGTGRWAHSLSGSPLLFGMLYLLLATVMIVYGFFNSTKSCDGLVRENRLLTLLANRQALLPLGLGVIMGINLCPPFLAAFAVAIRYPYLYQTILFFFSFFLGTSIFFLPLPLTGWIPKRRTNCLIGKLAAGIVGLYYLYSGIVLIYGGLFV